MPNSQNPVILRDSAAATNNSAHTISTGITISVSPSDVCTVENPVLWQFNSVVTTYPASSNPISNIKAYMIIQVNSSPAAGDKFIMSANTANDFATYEFEAADEPVINQFYCSTTVPSRSTADIADSIAFSMNQNQYFRNKFYAASSSNQVLIQALEYGARYNMQFQNVIGSTISMPTNNDSVDNYRSQALKDYAIWADTYIASVGDFGSTLNRTNSYRVAQSEVNFTADNLYWFDVGGVMKSYVSTPAPTIGSSTMQRFTDAMQNVYLVYGERYDEYKNNYRRAFLGGQTNVSWVLNSALGMLDVNSLTGYTNDNSGYQTKDYLTTSPSVKQTYLDSNEWLCFLYSNSNGSQLSSQHFAFELDINYVDGTQELAWAYLTQTSISSTAGGYYCANVSPNLLFTGQTYLGKLVRSYTIRLIRQQNLGAPIERLGVDKEYTLLNDCHSDGAREFHWVTTLGGWDSFWFNGEREISPNRRITTFTTPISYTPTSTDKMTIIKSIDYSKTYKSYSGYINEEHVEWLMNELSKTTDARIRVGSELIPIVILSVEPKPYISNQDLFQINIEYRYSIDENYIRQ